MAVCWYPVLLYDITSTYLEGDLESCPIAKRGYSRDSPGDRPQVCMGLVVTEDGFPFYPGGSDDSTSRFKWSETKMPKIELKSFAERQKRLTWMK